MQRRILVIAGCSVSGRPILKQGICFHRVFDSRGETHADQDGDRLFEPSVIHDMNLPLTTQFPKRFGYRRWKVVQPECANDSPGRRQMPAP